MLKKSTKLTVIFLFFSSYFFFLLPPQMSQKESSDDDFDLLLNEEDLPFDFEEDANVSQEVQRSNEEEKDDNGGQFKERYPSYSFSLFHGFCSFLVDEPDGAQEMTLEQGLSFFLSFIFFLSFSFNYSL